MEVQYQCTLADFLEVVAHQRKPIIYYVYWVGGLSFLCAGVLKAITAHFAEAFVMFVVAGLWLAWPLVIRPLSLRRHFRNLPNFALKQALVPEEEGLHTRSDTGRTENKWSAYTKFQETPNLFILWMGAGMFEAIPKRAFSPPELDGFRKLLVRHLPGK
jgi:hypothetical protein